MDIGRAQFGIVEMIEADVQYLIDNMDQNDGEVPFEPQRDDHDEIWSERSYNSNDTDTVVKMASVSFESDLYIPDE